VEYSYNKLVVCWTRRELDTHEGRQQTTTTAVLGEINMCRAQSARKWWGDEFAIENGKI